MKQNKLTVYFIVVISLIISLLLSLWPLPGTMNWLRPAWVQLVLLYWGIHLPQRVGVGWAWILGLLLDSLHGCLLGVHALACLLSLYLAGKLRRQFLQSPLWLQALIILAWILIYQLTIFVLQGFLGQVIAGWRYWLPCLTSAIIWPMVAVSLQTIRQRYSLG